jgi:threonine/homoserine/homoserine lactone efflux protein
MTFALTLLTLFASSFLIAFSGAMMPGPLLAATIGESARRGASAGPLLMAGHAMLELAFAALLLLGLAPVLSKDAVFAGIAIAGGSILLWMAWGMFRSLPRLTLAAADSRRPGNRIVLDGIVLSLSNPYWVIWWATVGVGSILQSARAGIAGAAAFYSGHILADFVWYGSVSFAVGKGRRFLSDRAYRGITAALAVLMTVFALAFLAAGAARAGAF